MKYAIPFTRKFSYWDNQDIEININYKPKIKELDMFIERYQTHRINIFLFNTKNLEKDLEIIQAIREKRPNSNVVLVLPQYTPELEQKLSGVPHYYNEIISTWDKFNGFLSLSVTDIIIGEEIAFSAKILSNNAKKNHKALRFYCNVCQSSWDAEQSLTTFFIRPQDIDLYEPYFDTCEFYTSPQQKHQLNVLYKSYAIDKKWFGQLKTLIVGYQGEDDNKYILPEFGIRRLSCDKKCNKTEPKTCSFCYRVIQTAKILEKNNLYIKTINN